MIDKHLKKTKIFFSFGMFLLLLVMLYGAASTKNIKFLRKEYYKNKLSYLKYEIKVSDLCENISFSDVLFNKNEKCFITSQYSDETNKKAKSVPVLLYHGVIDAVNDSDVTNISFDNFFNQMTALKKDGWNTVSSTDFLLFLQGKKELPEKSFLLTFDDGRKDSYYPVDPILKSLDYEAVIFVIGNSLGGKNNFYLGTDEIKEMFLSGVWDIQPHTFAGHNEIIINKDGGKGHFYGNRMWQEKEGRIETMEEYSSRIKEDIILAKSVVEGITGVNATLFAYPFGDYGQEMENFKNEKDLLLGYTRDIFSLSFYQGNAFNYPGEQKEIVRLNINNKITPEEIVSDLNSGLEKGVPYIEKDFNRTNWKNEWGVNEFVDKKMVIRSSDKTTGASSALKGSRTWDNYFFNAKINWKKGSNVAVLARYVDDNNYLACNFSDSFVRMESKIGGEKYFQEKKLDSILPKGNLSLGISVNDENVDCVLNDEIIFDTIEQNSKSKIGGIGLKIWDKEVNNSEIEVEQVFVDKLLSSSSL